MPAVTDAPAGLVLPLSSLLRAGAGAWMAARPASVAGLLGQDSPRSARWAVRGMAVRDLALALGGLAAWRRERGMAEWVGAQALADAGDAVAVLAAAHAGELARGRAYGVAVVAGASALTEAAAWWLLRDSPAVRS